MEDNDLNFIIDWRSCLQTLNPIDSNYQTFNVSFGENLNCCSLKQPQKITLSRQTCQNFLDKDKNDDDDNDDDDDDDDDNQM